MNKTIIAIIVAIIGGVFSIVVAFIENKKEVIVPTRTTYSGKIINFGKNNTITNIETQIINETEESR